MILRRIPLAIMLFLAVCSGGGQVAMSATPPNVDQLIAQLRTGDDKGKQDAAIKLAKVGSPAVKPLMPLLGDKDLWVASAAALALGRMGAPAIEPLRLTLESPNVDVRINAVAALGMNKDPRSIGILVSTFKSKPPRVGRCAALALWRQGSKAVGPLLPALKDTNADVRSDAAMALGGIKDKRAALPLIARLKDGDKSVRCYAAQALGSIRDPRAVKPLLTLFVNRQEYARHRAGEALGMIGDARAIEPLIRVLADKSEDSITRFTAASALGRFKTSRAIEALIGEFRDKDSFVREEACSALGSIGQPATKALLAALNDPSPTVRASAAMSFGLTFSVGKRAMEPLIAALADKDAVVRKSVALALVTTEDPRAKEALLRGLAGRDLAVVAGGFYFFIKLGKPGSEPVLVEALRSHGDHSMARDFYGSGNDTLRKAAAEWAKKHGEQLSASTLSPQWGDHD